ncbi:uncharacterized protein [Dysidea avara]|uniref:uncharacterized protein isoform X2 n=1 Tax=Dysidea avara TaxID=196820 RepID=UPI00332790DE
MIIFKAETNVTMTHNRALYGGGIYSSTMSSISFEGYSVVILAHNVATQNGGGVLSSIYSKITYTGYSAVSLYNNIAKQDGGAIYCTQKSYILISNNSIVMIQNNYALQNGGAVYLFGQSLIIFGKLSMVTISKNTAMEHGGALFLSTQSGATFQGDCIVTLNINDAKLSGGALYSSINSFINFQDNCKVTFYNNKCRQSGGALYLNAQSTSVILGTAFITFHDNEAIRGGGAIYSYDNSNITISNWSEVVLSGNRVTEYGGGVQCEGQSGVTLEGNASVTVINNIAQFGGAVYISQSKISFGKDSIANFTNNTAIDGGAMYLSENFLAVFSHGSSIAFSNNSAERYGGTILVKLIEHVNVTNLILNTTRLDFYNNTALVGNFIYIQVPPSCDDLCVNNSIVVGANIMSLSSGQLGGKHIVTTPSKLVLYDPATCINDDSSTICEKYLIKNIMLGQEIILNACVLDYYNQPVIAIQFLVSSTDQDHQTTSSDRVLIQCEMLQGTSVIGDKITKAEMFSINFTSHFETQLDLKTIFVQLVVELSPCHPGFHYDNKTPRCICYSDTDIISCIDSTSFIKEGYWFGEVNGKTTVTICPNNYCNFTCCKTTNEFYQLSPVRINQCLSHRSGTACGSCEEGYTLSFDSVECVSVKKCTTGHTALVVTLSMIYWIVIVILVFVMTYYLAGIGYLYAITYYYSVVDILLGEHLYNSQGLFTMVSIISSIAKVTPQFLGQLCFVQNQSGIDQQFIHYVHPVAVTIITALFCLSARLSNKLSAFVSRGIIHVICFLLLLSYTSVATTSLLLLRSLTFHNVDKVYTYLSPDTEYFHGRHLPYVIIAILCTLVIVIGLPLLLLLEPFLNSKVNLTRIKPLLDQFQGCYKDKYRSFAAYYMICRLVIIVIIIANSSNDDTTQYLLITVNATLALLHMTFRPCASEILNMFDGLILQLLIVVSMIPLIDSSDPDSLLAFTIVLVILPVVAFLIMEVYYYKITIKKIAKCCIPPVQDTTNDSNEIPMSDFVDSIIDDNSRRNATIVTVNCFSGSSST